MFPKAPSGYAPWSVAGGPDPDCSAAVREMHHRALTGADLLERYRRDFSDADRADYDTVVRRLGHVWDCPHDGAANVSGFRCAVCRRVRTERSERTQPHPRG